MMHAAEVKLLSGMSNARPGKNQEDVINIHAILTILKSRRFDFVSRVDYTCSSLFHNDADWDLVHKL